ncbi:hypothetical protein HK405_012406, partial [Cladochytrium tenue]
RPAPREFASTCRRFRRIAADRHTRAAWLVARYGRPLALLYSFRFHRAILDSEVGRLMLALGCGLPRFLLQIVDKEYHRPSRQGSQVSADLYAFFICAGFKAYGENSDFREDDISKFERTLYSSTASLEEMAVAVRSLITAFKFVPVKGFGSPIEESIYLVSKLDLSLVRPLVANGLDLSAVNDMIMERVFWRPDFSDAILQTYLNAGFGLSNATVKRGIYMARDPILQVLRARLPEVELQNLAEDTVVDLLGPTGRGWTFSPDTIDYIRGAFPISEAVMETALLRGAYEGPDLVDAFPATRCYLKASPCPIWRWVLATYGPAHQFTAACFDDALSRAAADKDLHALHDVFLDAGVRFRPRHVKILACRVLHRDMTANALHLLRAMRKQVVADARAGALTLESEPLSLPAPIATAAALDAAVSSASSSSSFTSSSSSSSTTTAAAVWARELHDEVTTNDDWESRMRTTQLEGGPRGGAFRITRPPDDALRFLEEARAFLADLGGPPPLQPPMPLAQSASNAPAGFKGKSGAGAATAATARPRLDISVARRGGGRGRGGGGGATTPTGSVASVSAGSAASSSSTAASAAATAAGSWREQRSGRWRRHRRALSLASAGEGDHRDLASLREFDDDDGDANDHHRHYGSGNGEDDEVAYRSPLGGLSRRLSAWWSAIIRSPDRVSPEEAGAAPASSSAASSPTSHIGHRSLRAAEVATSPAAASTDAA